MQSSFCDKQASAFRILFAKRPQGLCKICCGNLPAVAADIRRSFGFEKSKWSLRKRNLISNSDRKIGFVRIPRLNLCRCTAVLLMSSWGKGFGNQQHCMQLPWSRHVNFIYFVEVIENAIASRLFMPGIFHWVCGLWAESFLVRQIFPFKFEWTKKKLFACSKIWSKFKLSESTLHFMNLSRDRRLLLLFFKFEHLFILLSWI